MNKLDYIMLVDDDEATNFYHKIIIKEARLDVDILSFTYAQKALDFLFAENENSFRSDARSGIIFLDINMPALTGWDFMSEFEKLPAKQIEGMIIVILTTCEFQSDKEIKTLHPSIKKFMVKPLTDDMLREIINEYFLSGSPSEIADNSNTVSANSSR